VDPRELVGRWGLRRRIVDRRVGVFGAVAGELVLSPDGDGVRWDETGTLRWDGASYAVTRTYLLRPVGSGWEMRFADGRPFHPWRPGETVTHPCRADVYTGVVDVGPTRIRTVWDVTGPAKDQRLVTRCYRSAAIDSGVSVDS
jgi:hypothetical protein